MLVVMAVGMVISAIGLVAAGYGDLVNGLPTAWIGVLVLSVGFIVEHYKEHLK